MKKTNEKIVQLQDKYGNALFPIVKTQDIYNQIGDLEELKTTQKDNLVDAINENFQLGVKSNKTLTEALNSKGVEASVSDSILTNISKIKEIKTDPSVGTTNASSQDLLEGKTAYSKGNKIIGTIKTRKPINKSITLNNENIIIPKGYYDEDNKISSNITNLKPENIKKGVKVGGIIGNLTESTMTIQRYWNPVEKSGREVYDIIDFDFIPDVVIIVGKQLRSQSYVTVHGVFSNNPNLLKHYESIIKVSYQAKNGYLNWHSSKLSGKRFTIKPSSDTSSDETGCKEVEVVAIKF